MKNTTPASKQKVNKHGIHYVQARITLSAIIEDDYWQNRLTTVGNMKERQNDKASSIQHIKALTEDLRNGKRLKQVEVESVGQGKYRIVSGFHRMAAYRTFNKESGKFKQLRVHVLQDIPEDYYFKINTTEKAFLGMSTAQQRELAFQQTLRMSAAKATVAEIVKATKRSERTIKYWRSMYQKVKQSGVLKDTDQLHPVTGFPLYKVVSHAYHSLDNIEPDIEPETTEYDYYGIDLKSRKSFKAVSDMADMLKGVSNPRDVMAALSLMLQETVPSYADDLSEF